MALTGTDRGTGTHNTSSATLDVVPASNFAAGMAVLVVAMDNPASGNDITGVTDTKGNTWTIRQSPLIDPGAAAAGQQGIIATTPQNGGLLTTGDTITVAISVAKVAKTWTLMQVSGSVGTPTYVTGAIGTSGTGGTSPTITSGSIANGDMIVAGLVLEAGTTETITQDADSTNGSWSAQQTAEIGSTTSGSNVASQRKVVTAAATQTYNPTLGIAGDLALAWIQIHEALGIAPALLSQAPTLFAPVATSVATIAPALLDNAPSLFAPTVSSAGPQTVSPSLLSNAPTLFAPTVTSVATVAPALLSQTPTLFAPTVTSAATVAPALLSNPPTLFAPTVTPGAVSVSPSLLSNAPTLFAPTVTTSASIAPSLLSQTPVLFAPTVTSLATVSPALLSQTPTLFAPAVSARADISPALLSNAPTLFAPTVSVASGALDISPSLLSNAPTLFAPTITTGPVFVTPALLSQVPVLFAPTVSAQYSITAGLISNPPVLFAPTVAPAVWEIALALLSNPPVLFTPSLAGEVIPSVEFTSPVFGRRGIRTTGTQPSLGRLTAPKRDS